MEAFLLEDLHEKLVNILQHRMSRNPANYRFIMGTGSHSGNFLYKIEVFLKNNNIPFFVLGMSVNTEGLLPVPATVVENYEHGIFLPSGMFCIYPDSDEEIIICLYHRIESSGFGSRTIEEGYIAGYRDQSAFDGLISNLKRFRADEIRKDGKVIVTDDDNVERPSLSWDDVILPPALKNDVRNNIEYFMRSEMMYRKLGIPYKRGLLFVGPPGNGKTMLLKVIASQYTEWQMIIFTVKTSSDNYDLNKAFQAAKEYAPSIICFEDLDSLFNSNLTMSHFLNKLDGFGKHDRVMVLATTNHPENIDPALLNRPSRFDRVWVIENPDVECRRMFIRKKFAGPLSEDFIDDLAHGTDKFSMAYMEELYIASSLAAINRGKDLPGETEIWESLEQLSLQVRGASHQFANRVTKIGFISG